MGRLLVLLLAVAAALPAAAGAGQHVTKRCPVDALPLRSSDLPALRRFALTLAPRGADYRDAKAKAKFPTFYTGYVRSACPGGAVRRVIARTADVSVGYPHITWSASLSSSTFLIARTRHGFVAWAQMH